MCDSSSSVRVPWLLLVAVYVAALGGECDAAWPSWSEDVRYTPDWPSLDKRPLPAWYDQAKLGIFIHWGVFCVPSYGSEWFWWNWKGSHVPSIVNFMSDNYKPNWDYPDFAPQFTTELYDADYWAKVLASSGAKYVVLTSKHHEGFTMFPSSYSWNWNAATNGPNRDLLGELATAVRKHSPSVKFGLYYSLFEWFHPLYLRDKKNEYKTQDYVKNKMHPELVELIETYKPEVVWSDGDWEAADTYWNSTNFLAWLYNDSPVKDTVVTNDRWGAGCMCKHGGYYTCHDKYNPGVLQNHKWENCMTIDRGSWGYRRNAVLADFLTIEELLSELISTVSCGGNLLMNIGPTHDGRIAPIFEERLMQMGTWLGINGQAIYSTTPWKHQNDTVTKNFWYTSSNDGSTVYGSLLSWPSNDTVSLGVPVVSANSTKVLMLGYSGPQLSWRVLNPSTGTGIIIDLKNIAHSQLKSQWAWVFAFKNLRN